MQLRWLVDLIRTGTLKQTEPIRASAFNAYLHLTRSPGDIKIHHLLLIHNQYTEFIADMSTKAGSMLDLAKQLVASLSPDSTKSQAELDAAARRVASQVQRHAGAAMRKEWHEVRGTLKRSALEIS